MATAERPPAKIDGKPNPAYQKWYRAQKAAAKRPETPLDVFIQGDGKEPAGTLTDEALSAAMNSVFPEPLTLRVVKLARNARWVYCDLNGVKVPVAIKKGLQQRLLKKKIQVRKEGEHYVHIR